MLTVPASAGGPKINRPSRSEFGGKPAPLTALIETGRRVPVLPHGVLIRMASAATRKINGR